MTDILRPAGVTTGSAAQYQAASRGARLLGGRRRLAAQAAGLARRWGCQGSLQPGACRAQRLPGSLRASLDAGPAGSLQHRPSARQDCCREPSMRRMTAVCRQRLCCRAEASGTRSAQVSDRLACRPSAATQGKKKIRSSGRIAPAPHRAAAGAAPSESKVWHHRAPAEALNQHQRPSSSAAGWRTSSARPG